MLEANRMDLKQQKSKLLYFVMSHIFGITFMDKYL